MVSGLCPRATLSSTDYFNSFLILLQVALETLNLSANYYNFILYISIENYYLSILHFFTIYKKDNKKSFTYQINKHFNVLFKFQFLFIFNIFQFKISKKLFDVKIKIILTNQSKEVNIVYQMFILLYFF